MMISGCPNQMGLRVAALAGLLVVAAAPVSAQQPGRNPFEGEWTLTFDVATPPGGVPLPWNPHYHMAFHASKRSFQVKADGTFSWREADDGSYKMNTTVNVAGTQTEAWATHQPLLKVGGKATATPTPAGSPQPYDRSLEVNLDWSAGNGAYGDNHGGAGTYIVDAAGEQMTVSGVNAPPTTLPVTYLNAKWELKPASTVREEISPDQIRETITYKDSRQAEVPSKIGNYKVTERIEVKHVRNLGLVPRDAQRR
jgi:hypothetical protein